MSESSRTLVITVIATGAALATLIIWLTIDQNSRRIDQTNDLLNDRIDVLQRQFRDGSLHSHDWQIERLQDDVRELRALLLEHIRRSPRPAGASPPPSPRDPGPR